MKLKQTSEEATSEKNPKPSLCFVVLRSKEQAKTPPEIRAAPSLQVVADPMVTRWNQKSPGLKILWIWTLGTAAIMIGNVVRTRVNDMEMILREEDEAAAGGGGGTGTGTGGGTTSGERVMRDDELSSE
uniref:Uncharacterized protein n=1 Tax=Avena sativa TaxID=4498 RepID=A0ACD5UWP3_AVESA